MSENDHTLVCTGCGNPIGHQHNEDCEFSPGIVLASQSVEAASQPRCLYCRQRCGRPHLPSCGREGSVQPVDCEAPLDPVTLLPVPSIEERAAAVVEELSTVSNAPKVVVVQMHDESATDPDAVLECVPFEQRQHADSIIGVWAMGHVVVAKDRDGKTGIAPSALSGGKRFGRRMKEWPRKLIWGMFTRPNEGYSGLVKHPDDIEEISRRFPDAEFEPYIPTRNLNGALRVKIAEVEAELEKGGIPNALDALRAEADAYTDILDLIDHETWTGGE